MTATGITRKWWLFWLAIILMAAVLRFPALDQVPPGFQFDEAYNALDAVRVLQGDRPLFLPANGGREVLYTYLQSLILSLLGTSVYAMRFASALLGWLTVGASFFLVRTLFRQPDPTPHHGRETILVGLLTAAFTATSYWHLHFSRYGIRAINLPLLEVLLYCAFWEGLRTKHMGWWLAAGILLGLGPYTHPAGRFLPFIITAFVLYKLATQPSSARAVLSQWATMGVTAAVVFLPLARYFGGNPEAFTGHASLVSVFNPQVSGGNPAGMILDNLLAVLGMFAFHGDGAWNHNLSGRPVFDPVTAALFAVGLGVVCVRLARGFAAADHKNLARNTRALALHPADPYLFILIWLGVMFTPTLLSSGAPDFSRSIGALPALFILPAQGLVTVGGRLSARHWSLTAALVVVVLGLGCGLTVRDYFFRFPQATEVYHIYDVDKIEAVRHLENWAKENHIYLSPLWAEHATVAFLTRGLNLKSFDSGETLVLPSRESGRDALYVFSWEQTPYIESFAERMAPLAERTDVPNSRGGRLLVAFRIPFQRLPRPDRPLESLAEQGFALSPQKALDIHFADEIRLLGATLPDAIPAASARPLTLFWQSTGQIDRDYTVFVHLLDGRGRRWGQDDRRPNQGGYPTTVWEPGELIIDHYWPLVDPCAPPGGVQVLAGLYHWPTQERLAVKGTGFDSVALGSLRLSPPERLTLLGREPAIVLDQGFDGLRFLGTDGLPETVVSGGILPVNLYWRAEADFQYDHGWKLALRPSGKDDATITWDLAPTVRAPSWQAGEGLCTHHDLSIPPETAPGDYAVVLSVPDLSDDSLMLGTVKVEHMDRSFEPPDPEYPLAVRVGTDIILLGYDLPRPAILPGAELSLTLYWQTQATPHRDYKVFVHLTDERDAVVAQVDSPPAGGRRSTSTWLPGEVVTDSLTLAPASGLQPGTYRLAVGMYDQSTGARLPLYRNDVRLPDDRLFLDVPIEVTP